MADLIDSVAEYGGESEEEEYDEETGEPSRRLNGMNGARDDSSEEDEDDDDEEAEREVREGFIVDEDDDEADAEERRRRRKERKKRKAAEREEDEALDEEDLDLIGIGRPVDEEAEPKFKRLKRGHRDDRTTSGQRGIDEIFSDEDEDGERRRDTRMEDAELEDFIEEDEFPEDEDDRAREEVAVGRKSRRNFGGITALAESGLDEESLEDYRNAFGDMTEYDWALAIEEEQEHAETAPDKAPELKDVFEPSQLAEKMLTEEDNEIRNVDVPERYQLARSVFKPREISDEQRDSELREEARWISKLLWPKKQQLLDRYLHEPFDKAVLKVLQLMNVEDFEVPFIFHHRKDYLIHLDRTPVTPDPNNPDAPQILDEVKKLLLQNDLWEIVELDLRFKAVLEKRDAINKTYDNLKSVHNIEDDVIDTMVPLAETMEELQDIQDYLHFRYATELKDLNLQRAETNGVQKRVIGSSNLFEKIRSSSVYNLVKALGITADEFAQNALGEGRRKYTDDSSQRPDDMSDTLVQAPDFSTGLSVMRAARTMLAEEFYMSPRVRKLLRQTYYMQGIFDCHRTDKGLRRIDEDHPYYEFKYLRGQEFGDMVRRPELYLRLLKAEEEGLIEVKIRLINMKAFKERLYKEIESDNVSEVADAWNTLRREIVDHVVARLEKIMVKGVKENLRTECENMVAKACRDEFIKKLDQAPFKPAGMELGTVPRVLALSNGSGNASKDATCWVYVEDDGRIVESGKYVKLQPGNSEKNRSESKDVEAFCELVQRRKPDVIAVSGFSVEARRLFEDIRDIIDQKDLQTAQFPVPDNDGEERTAKLEAVLVNDEIARLYQNSARAATDHPRLSPLYRYCAALAHYLQDPLKQYAALGKDIMSISFDANQGLIPKDKLAKYLETAMVDMVNLVGVDINEAVQDTYTANLLPFVCGLGPRKATQLVKVVNINGGEVTTREELVFVADDGEDGVRVAPLGPKVWANSASFIYIEYDKLAAGMDYLDNTRVHPEDYELARKMAADALDFDEEDIKAEVDEYGPGAVVKRLVNEDAQDKVNDLVLEEYASQLESKFSQRKRATLENIRAELQSPYEELRRNFVLLSTDEIFTMLTGETKDSLQEGMIIPVLIRRIFQDHIEVKLDCGIEGGIAEHEYPEGIAGSDPRNVYGVNQTVQAKLLYLDRKKLNNSQLSLREDALRHPFRKEIDRDPGTWDEVEEEKDKITITKEKEKKTGRQQRVIKHPLFRPFNSAQAEEFLGSQGRGDVVIRPSSKGLDHLAVTWKVSDNVFQHIDVLELDKENEFSVGKTLKIGGKYTYSDLDELIVNHVKAMARKVEEMMGDERYQRGSKAQTDEWLKTYCMANPKGSMYAFCLNEKFPGYFYLCFKAGREAEQGNWPVKIIPNAFELQASKMQRTAYPTMRDLKNGFKLLIQNNAARGAMVRR